MPALQLMPVTPTPALMQELEDQGLIIRLAPRHHEAKVERGEAKGTRVYEAEASHGGHMLLACTINQAGLQRFGYHLEREEFLMLGDPSREPLYLAIFLGQHPALEEKIRSNSVSADDFVCLRIVWNDPELSFFTMLAGVPHGECVLRETDRPPSFYVTEPTGMTLEKLDFGPYQLEIAPT